MKYSLSTDFSKIPLDELLPLFRKQKLEIPDWAYAAAQALANYNESGNGCFFMTPEGLQTTGKEVDAAIFAAILSVHYKKD